MNLMNETPKNPAQQDVEHFRVAYNAYAKWLEESGHKAPRITAANARGVYRKVIEDMIALADNSSKRHNQAYNSLIKDWFTDGRDQAMSEATAIGKKFADKVFAIAQNAQTAGHKTDEAIEIALNSVAGNPGFDHLLPNLNVLAAQLYEEMPLVRTFQEMGDAFNLPSEAGGTGRDRSRFRAPRMQVTGSPKRYQGDLNPVDHGQNDTNRGQINFFNEFKDAITEYETFSITQDMKDQFIGYQRAVDPALASVVLQNRFFTEFQKLILKKIEMYMADGHKQGAVYTPNVGGNYGLLSPNIRLTLGSAGAAMPLVASSADWAANTTKLLQVITNYSYKPATVAAPLDISKDPSLFYLEIVRLLNMFAQRNVDWGGKIVLYMPTTFYGLGVQYPGTQSQNGQGTFNKNLIEMIETATGDKNIISKIEFRQSSLMNYRAKNFYGDTLGCNYILAVAQGCPSEKKPVIMPSQTTMPYVVASEITQEHMNFKVIHQNGGPMFMHLGGAILLQFSVAA